MFPQSANISSVDWETATTLTVAVREVALGSGEWTATMTQPNIVLLVLTMYCCRHHHVLPQVTTDQEVYTTRLIKGRIGYG